MDGQAKPQSSIERLFFAVKDGDLQTAAELLALGVTPHLREDSSGMTPLHVAAYLGNAEAVRLLLSHGANPRLRDYSRVTPLHAAAYLGHAEIVRELLAAGAEMDARNEQGFTPLHDAANHGHEEVVQLLLDAGANIDATANKQETPLHMAAHHGRQKAVRALIDHGARLHEKTVDGLTPLLLAADQRHLPVVRLLLDARQGGAGMGLPAEAKASPSEALEICRRAAGLRREWQDESNRVQAEALFREAIRRFPECWEGHFGLGELLQLKVSWEKPKSGPLIDEMIRELREAAKLAPDHVEPMLKLAKAVAELDVESAGPLYRKAVDTTVPGRPTLYEESWQAADHWNIAIRAAGKAGHEALSFEAFCRAIDLDPDDYGGYVMPADDQARSIWSLALLVKPAGAKRSRASGAPRKSKLQRAVDNVLQEPDLASLHNQSLLVGQRYFRTKELEDLKEALDLADKAVRLAPAHPKALSNQGYLLKLLYDQLGRLEDLRASIASFKAAVENSDDGAERLSDLNNLASMWHMLYGQTSRLDHLERSIEAAREVVEATPKVSPRRPIYVSNLGGKLLERYKRTGVIEDLETAVRIYKEGLEELLPESPYQPTFVYNLAIALRIRSEQNQEPNDLDRAIGYFEQACAHTPKDSLDYPIRLNGLATGLLNRYSAKDSIEDLKRSIAILEIAVNRTAPDSPLLSLRLANLAHALGLLWETNGNQQDLERSIALYERLERITSPESSLWPVYLLNHGSALALKWRSSRSSDDWRRAIDTLQRSACSGQDTSVHTALIAARQWLSLAVDEKKWDEAQRAYGHAWEASEKLVRIQFLRRDKESWLEHTQGLAASAAFAFAKTGRLAEAAEALERGQARLLGETLAKERTAFERLAASGRADLLERYREAIGQIHHFSGQEARSPDARARIAQAQAEIERILQTVQGLEGFEDFLQPATFADVQRAAALRPLIYVAATPAGGLALVTGAGSAELISPVWLPKLTTDTLKAALWGMETSGGGILGAQRAWQQCRDLQSLSAWLSATEDCGRWLWDIALTPILQAFPGLREASLIPIGSLGLLPLHAAWCEDPARPTGRLYLLDLLTVSYSPNARTLLEARAVAERVAPRKLLAVDEPRPTSSPPLPGSKPEVSAAVAHFKEPTIIRHQKATRGSVLSALPGHDVLHFSCHGHVELADPLSSSLLMAHDQPLTLGDILNLRLEGVRLAVLSACETGVPGLRLPEEVVSLPSGLLQAGAAGVVSSLASVEDFSTMLLISSFYSFWRHGASDPAQALRRAQIWMRDTTNGEKVRAAEEARHGLSRPGSPWWPPETACAILAKLGSRNPETRDFSHPAHWGAFHYVGA